MMRTKVTLVALAVAAAVGGSAGWALSTGNADVVVVVPAASVVRSAPMTAPTGWTCPETVTVPGGPSSGSEEPVSAVNFPRNASGQTYGQTVPGPLDNQPDLIAAMGKDEAGRWIEGYALRCDLFSMEADRRLVPLYAFDGQTVLGSLKSPDNAHPGPNQIPTRD